MTTIKMRIASDQRGLARRSARLPPRPRSYLVVSSRAVSTGFSRAVSFTTTAPLSSLGHSRPNFRDTPYAYAHIRGEKKRTKRRSARFQTVVVPHRPHRRRTSGENVCRTAKKKNTTKTLVLGKNIRYENAFSVRKINAGTRLGRQTISVPHTSI